MSQKLRTYNKFVDYYDEIIRGNWYDIDSEVFFLNEIIEDHAPHPPLKGAISILEFACGTGTIARELEKKWCCVTWVDLSELMIEKCDDNKKFIVWDMTSINLEQQFDVVLCNYNSVCHLHSWEDWQKFFQNAYKHLKKDGILVFDILTLFEFENISRDFKWFFNVAWDTICLEMFKKPTTLHVEERGDAWKAEGIFTWLIKMFVNQWNNNFELIEEEIREISFKIEKIKKELEWVWFSIEHLEDFHFWEVTSESERVYFVVKK